MAKVSAHLGFTFRVGPLEQNQYGRVDLLSNGFKVRSAGGASENASTGNYIYLAWAYNPFVTSPTKNSIPATAR